MKAMAWLSACSLALALMVGASALAQEREPLTQEAQEDEAAIRAAERARLAAEGARQSEQLRLMTVPFMVRQVAVECNGDCGDSTLGTICGSGWMPIAVDCQNVQEWLAGQSVQCGYSGNNRCARWPVLPTDRLSFYCDDFDGWDANMYCAQ